MDSAQRAGGDPDFTERGRGRACGAAGWRWSGARVVWMAPGQPNARCTSKKRTGASTAATGRTDRPHERQRGARRCDCGRLRSTLRLVPRERRSWRAVSPATVGSRGRGVPRRDPLHRHTRQRSSIRDGFRRRAMACVRRAPESAGTGAGHPLTGSRHSPCASRHRTPSERRGTDLDARRCPSAVQQRSRRADGLVGGRRARRRAGQRARAHQRPGSSAPRADQGGPGWHPLLSDTHESLRCAHRGRRSGVWRGVGAGATRFAFCRGPRVAGMVARRRIARLRLGPWALLGRPWSYPHCDQGHAPEHAARVRPRAALRKRPAAMVA